MLLVDVLDVTDICSVELHADLYTDVSFSCCYFKHTLLLIVNFNTMGKPKQCTDKSSGLTLQSCFLFRLTPKFIHAPCTLSFGLCLHTSCACQLRAMVTQTTDLFLIECYVAK